MILREETGIDFIIFALYLLPCDLVIVHSQAVSLAVFGTRLCITMADMSREELLKLYYTLGCTNREIRAILAAEHDIFVSERHMKRFMNKEGLYQRKHHDPITCGMWTVTTN